MNTKFLQTVLILFIVALDFVIGNSYNIDTCGKKQCNHSGRCASDVEKDGCLCNKGFYGKHCFDRLCRTSNGTKFSSRQWYSKFCPAEPEHEHQILAPCEGLDNHCEVGICVVAFDGAQNCVCPESYYSTRCSKFQDPNHQCSDCKDHEICMFQLETSSFNCSTFHNDQNEQLKGCQEDLDNGITCVAQRIKGVLVKVLTSKAQFIQEVEKDKCKPKCQSYQECKKYEVKIRDTTYRMPIFRCLGDPPTTTTTESTTTTTSKPSKLTEGVAKNAVDTKGFHQVNSAGSTDTTYTTVVAIISCIIAVVCVIALAVFIWRKKKSNRFFYKSSQVTMPPQFPSPYSSYPPSHGSAIKDLHDGTLRSNSYRPSALSRPSNQFVTLMVTNELGKKTTTSDKYAQPVRQPQGDMTTQRTMTRNYHSA